MSQELVKIDLETVELKNGSHADRADGVCVMEAAAWLAGEKHSDAPTCVSPVIRAFTIRLNDRLPDAERQQLKVLLPIVIGTNDNRENDRKRAWMATDFAIRVAAPIWLRLAGLTAEADLLAGLGEISSRDLWLAAEKVIEKVKDAAYALRQKSWQELRSKVKAALPADAADAYAADAADAYDAAAYDAAAYAAAAYDAAAWKKVYTAAYAAVSRRLAPTRLATLAAAIELVKRMAAVGR